VVVAPKEDVEEALARIPSDCISVLVAYCPRHGLRIGRHKVRSELGWGQGQGLAVIRRRDLARLLEQARYALCIEAFYDDWVGWIDSTPAGAPQGLRPQSRRFGYYSPETKTEES
jgi:hypothetical protein